MSCVVTERSFEEARHMARTLGKGLDSKPRATRGRRDCLCIRLGGFIAKKKTYKTPHLKKNRVAKRARGGVWTGKYSRIDTALINCSKGGKKSGGGKGRGEGEGGGTLKPGGNFGHNCVAGRILLLGIQREGAASFEKLTKRGEKP